MSELLLSPLVLLFTGVFVALSVASLVARRLVSRNAAASPERAATLRNLSERIRAWWFIIGTLALAFALGSAATILLFLLVSFWCLREFLSITPTGRSDHYMLAAAFYVFLPLQYVLIWIDWIGMFFVAIPVYAYLILPMIAVLAGDTTDFLQRVSKVQWGLMLAVYSASHVPALLLLNIPGMSSNFGLLAFLLIVVQGSDVLQYVFGKLYGRHRIAPGVSPNKTWEGFVFGGGAATALGAALWWITPFTIPVAAVVAFCIVLAGFSGGLVLSAVKRSLGAKDWGTMIEGHGGMLDRMDSLTFAAPILFHLTRYFYTV